MQLKSLTCSRLESGSRRTLKLSSTRLTSKCLSSFREFRANLSSSFPIAEIGDLRFTQTEEAFYILSLTEPSETFVVNASLPILPGDSISMIGAGNRTSLSWTSSEEGVTITVPSALISAGQHCWVFKIAYRN